MKVMKGKKGDHEMSLKAALKAMKEKSSGGGRELMAPLGKAMKAMKAMKGKKGLKSKKGKKAMKGKKGLLGSDSELSTSTANAARETPEEAAAWAERQRVFELESAAQRRRMRLVPPLCGGGFIYQQIE